MEQEIENIKKIYDQRKKDVRVPDKYEVDYAFYITQEREKIYKDIVVKHFSDIKNCLFIEIGAGAGGNLHFFNKLGIPYENIVANELLDDRVHQLKDNYPEVTVHKGNAVDMEINQKFDIVFQSTVFTSILNKQFRIQLADKMWKLLNDKGIILWYDFTYDNPANKNVKKVGKKEIKKLFPAGTKYEFYKVTLAPPIGRRLGHLYTFINKFKFLRTHLIAVIYK